MAHCTSVLLPLRCSFYHKLLPKKTAKQTLPRNVTTRRQTRSDVTNPQQSYETIDRRSVNYKPSSWNLELLEYSGNDQGTEVEKVTIKKCEEEIRCILEDEDMEPLALLELIDDIHRLGVGYRFRENTNRALAGILPSSDQVKEKLRKSLHASALYFRLLRQHGYEVSTDIFDSFKDPNGKFNTNLALDVQGMLSLYEASHFAFIGENILDEAREFTSFHLKNLLGKIDKDTSKRVSRALELPFHHRMQRLEARWNIETYDHKQNQANKLLHAMSVLDFNMVQLTHRQQLQEASRWWGDVGLAKQLSFARDRLVESFFWATGMVYETQYSKCRKELTKVVKLITILDDVYDVYGSLEELEQLTEAVERWDISTVNHLPHYMKLYFLALYNTVNNIAYDTLKEQGKIVIPQLKKVWADLCKAFLEEAKWSYEKSIPKWADLCKAFLEEAKWSYEKSIPKVDEYMNYGWISSSGAILLLHAYLLTTQNITEEALKYLTEYQGLLQFPSKIFRLANDLISYEAETQRGETTNAITCYMHETGESEEVARAYVRKLIDENWKMMNKEMVHNSLFDKSFIEIAINLARIALCQYQYGDAHSSPDDSSRNRVSSVIIEPIQFVKTDEQNMT